MITIPILTRENMYIFNGKKVILYSMRSDLRGLYKIFKYLNIDVLGVCIEFDPYNKQPIRDYIRGIRWIKPEELAQYAKNNDNVIIQSVAHNSADIVHINQIAKQFGLDMSPIASGQIYCSFAHLLVHKEWDNALFVAYKKMRWKYGKKPTMRLRWYGLQSEQTPIVICSAQKTADISLMNTFHEINAIAEAQKLILPIRYVNLWHYPNRWKLVSAQRQNKKTKILMGVRDPISQNISELYQRLSNGYSPESFLHMTWNMDKRLSNSALLKECDYMFQEDLNFVQALWDKHMERCSDANYFISEGTCVDLIQHFMIQFQKHIVDITRYPFNQEKGYTIIKEGNVEVFIYQLEKLNNLVPELSEWVGVLFNKLENGNQASDKWIAESYKQAQKELEITQDYFDKCFNEPYVKHCYSEADIEKFKARWRPHIKKQE